VSTLQLSPELVPKENLEAYGCLFRIENALRELSIELFQRLDGPKWYKHRLPPDVFQKYREGIAAQRKVKWASLTLHHPIYYLDFPHLRKMIEVGPNWESGFHSIFGRKDIIASELSEVEEIRNSVAHNRKITHHDLITLKSTEAKIAQAIGIRKFVQLTNRSTSTFGISDKLRELSREASVVCQAIGSYQKISNLGSRQSTTEEWWFDDSYLGQPLEAVADFYAVVDEYASLPRTRGSGYLIESWVKKHDVPGLFAKMDQIISKIAGQA
jgi:hypothetical protein